MATIDLTLDALKIPNINGTFPFGTKITQTELNHGGLSTTEVNSNVMLPFTQMRPKICDEDSDTSQVEYDAKVVFNAPQGTTPAAGYTLTMGNGTYIGCTVTYTNLMEYACTVKQSDGTTTLFSVPAGKTMSAMWNGTAWLWTTTGSVTANDPTPVSSAAVHAAIGSITDLSSQITNKISVVTEASLLRCVNLCTLTFRLRGAYTFSSGTTVMELPVGSKSGTYISVTGLSGAGGSVVFTISSTGLVQIWDVPASSNVDYMATCSFFVNKPN